MNINSYISGISALNWFRLSFLLSLGLILGALFFEHVLKYSPCQMCYWQRDTHKVVMAVAALGTLYKLTGNSDKWDRPLLFFVSLAFLGSFAMAFWHMGVEYKWWLGPKSCAAPDPTTINPDDILNALNNGGKMPQCSDAPWDLFGISMAGYNAIISGVAAVASFARTLKGSGHVK